MEGNEFREDGGGRFTTIGATERFSPLDQYAMGLIPPATCRRSTTSTAAATAEAAPQIGVRIPGAASTSTIDQIIAAEGPRVPAANKAPHTLQHGVHPRRPRPATFPSDGVDRQGRPHPRRLGAVFRGGDGWRARGGQRPAQAAKPPGR